MTTTRNGNISRKRLEGYDLVAVCPIARLFTWDSFTYDSYCLVQKFIPSYLHHEYTRNLVIEPRGLFSLLYFIQTSIIFSFV